MVWGMSLPSNFGEFWPQGDFEGDYDAGGSDGWSERLDSFYQAQPPEVRKELFDYAPYGARLTSYPYYVSRKFNNELGTAEGASSPPLNSIKDHESPHSFNIVRGTRSFGSLIKLNNQILAVDEALKTIIERLDPGGHRFFPLEIRMRKGELYPVRYYTLVIGRYFDSFSPEDSNSDSWSDYGPKYPDFYYYKHEKYRSGIMGLSFKKEIFNSANLWRERRFNQVLICLSNELHDEIADAGLRVPKHYQMREV